MTFSTAAVISLSPSQPLNPHFVYAAHPDNKSATTATTINPAFEWCTDQPRSSELALSISQQSSPRQKPFRTESTVRTQRNLSYCPLVLSREQQCARPAMERAAVGTAL